MSVLGSVVSVMTLALAPTAYGASSPVTIGSNSVNSPSQAAVAVDSSGTAYAAWLPSGNASKALDVCKVPLGATGCTPVPLAVPDPAHASFFDPPSVLLENGDVYVFETALEATAAPHDWGIYEYVSTDGGTSFTAAPTAVGFVPGNAQSTMNPVIALPGSNIGMGWVVPAGNPAFQANSLTSPSDYSESTGPPYATLNPSPNNYNVSNLGGQFAAQLTGAMGVLGVFGLVESGPCPSNTGLVYAFASLPGSNTALSTTTGPGSAWAPVAPVDCNTQYPAVAGGPSGLGVLESNQSTNTTEYRSFQPPSTLGAPVKVAPGQAIQPSLTQDGAGGIYATWLSSGTLELAYSATHGVSWSGPTALTQGAQVAFASATSSVNGAGQGWAVYAANGIEYAQPFDKTLVIAPAPKNTAPPKITGKARPGKTLTCSTGSWTNSPTRFTYQWNRDGTPLAGATGRTYSVQKLDEGTTLSCTVTAANLGGASSATSRAVKVPIPFVRRCPGATGRLSGATLGLVKLGMTHQRARYLYRFHSDRGKHYEDFFCLTPIGVRVGYASPKLLKALSKHERNQLKGRVVWASTSNPHYAIDGVRPGETIAEASLRLATEPPLHIGLNDWYLARKATSTAVLKVRRGVVEEIGIADNALTATRQSQAVLMHSFY